MQIYMPVTPPGIHCKLHHLWKKDPLREAKELSPTNYLVRDARLRTQSVTVPYNKMRPYKGAPPVGHEEGVYALTEYKKPPDGSFGRGS